jgi:hypothetical protein
VNGAHRSYLGVGVVSAQVVWGADAAASDESSRNRSYRGEGSAEGPRRGACIGLG